MKPILEVRNLDYIYSAGTPFEHKALDNVSFALEPGEFVGIIGHTGSGKSTLMQQMNGLLKPTSGQVLLDGVDIWSDKKLTRQARFRVGLVFQYPEYQLFEETVYRDIAFGPKNMGLEEKEVDRRVREAAGFVGLTEQQLEVSPFDLSGGQKRRVAIAGTPSEVFSRAQELLAMGLNIPQVTQVFLKLKALGLDVKSVYTMEQAVAEIVRLRGGKTHA